MGSQPPEQEVMSLILDGINQVETLYVFCTIL